MSTRGGERCSVHFRHEIGEGLNSVKVREREREREVGLFETCISRPGPGGDIYIYILKPSFLFFHRRYSTVRAAS